jgi:hypothetical protein
MRLPKGVITALLIMFVVADSLYQASIGIHTSDYALYLRTHPPALTLFITLYIMLAVFFYVIARWWS